VRKKASLFVSVLFLLFSCGIPSIYKFDDTYRISTSGSTFTFSCTTTSSDYSFYDEPLQEGTPSIILFYAIMDGNETSYSSLFSYLTSNYRTEYYLSGNSISLPTNYEYGICDYTYTGDDGESKTLKLYPFAIVKDGSSSSPYVPSTPKFHLSNTDYSFKGNTSKTIAIGDWVSNPDTEGKGKILPLTIDGDKYYLYRSNGAAFSLDSTYNANSGFKQYGDLSCVIGTSAYLMIYAGYYLAPGNGAGFTNIYLSPLKQISSGSKTFDTN